MRRHATQSIIGEAVEQNAVTRFAGGKSDGPDVLLVKVNRVSYPRAAAQIARHSHLCRLVERVSGARAGQIINVTGCVNVRSPRNDLAAHRRGHFLIGLVRTDAAEGKPHLVAYRVKKFLNLKRSCAAGRFEDFAFGDVARPWRSPFPVDIGNGFVPFRVDDRSLFRYGKGASTPIVTDVFLILVGPGERWNPWAGQLFFDDARRSEISLEQVSRIVNARDRRGRRHPVGRHY